MIMNKNIAWLISVLFLVTIALVYVTNTRNVTDNQNIGITRTEIHPKPSDNEYVLDHEFISSQAFTDNKKLENDNHNSSSIQESVDPEYLIKLPVMQPTLDEIDSINYSIKNFGLAYTQFEIDHRMMVFDKHSDKDDQTLESLAMSGDMDAAIELYKRSWLIADTEKYLHWSQVAIENGAMGPIGELIEQYQYKLQSTELSYAWARVGAMRGGLLFSLRAADIAMLMEPAQVGRGEILAQLLFKEISDDRMHRLGTHFEPLDIQQQEVFLDKYCGGFLSYQCNDKSNINFNEEH